MSALLKSVSSVDPVSTPSGPRDALSIARAALQASTARKLPQWPGESLGSFKGQPGSLSLGPALDALLPDGGLAWGQVTELCVADPSYATSLSLLACARAQAEGLQATGNSVAGKVPWCAFVDPFESLYAPGVAQAGVDLERLLVVRPPVAALSRLVVQLVEARAFALVVVDTCSFIGRPVSGPQQIDLTKWGNVVRRLNTAITNTHSAVLLLTDKNAPRPLPLPVALRLELSCPSPGVLKAHVAKDKLGRISLPHTVMCRDFVPAVYPELVEGVP